MKLVSCLTGAFWSVSATSTCMQFDGDCGACLKAIDTRPVWGPSCVYLSAPAGAAPGHMCQPEKWWKTSEARYPNVHRVTACAPTPPAPPAPPPPAPTPAPSPSGVPLTLLPQDKGDESPAGLDGSPYGFYFKPSLKGSTKWTIYLQGGGWCYDEDDCLDRSKSNLGSSKFLKPTIRNCGCSNILEDGSKADCNCLWMPYLDGASFSGFRAKPWSVPSNGSELLYFRGIKNLDAGLDFAFAHGLDKATEFVLTGTSAGGLSTFLHADRVADRLARQAPDCKRVTAKPIVGFFLDHDNFVKDSNSYTDRMKYIYAMQNMTFGPDGGLDPVCQKAYPEKPHFCFMSPHMQSFVQTPFFMLNSKYDRWQLENILQTTWTTAETQAAVLQYGEDFMQQLKPLFSEPKHGAAITSCICHGCPWNNQLFGNKTAGQHYADWYYHKASGTAAIHIDPREPNGDRTMTDKQCADFPVVRNQVVV